MDFKNKLKHLCGKDDILYKESILIRATAIFSAFVLIASVVFGLLPTDEDLDIYDKILRLHVIANSDSDTDQSLKLAVRDTVLKNLGEKLSGCADRFEAETIAENKKEELCTAAEETLRQGGSDDDVRIEIGKEYYPTRIYEGVRLPAGTYNSLRVIIGKGAGHNWWCVLFPVLCTSSASEPNEEFTDAGFTPGQIKVLTETEKPKYVLKFKILEFFGSLGHKNEESKSTEPEDKDSGVIIQK
jgi:stage II sporulation protein R